MGILLVGSAVVSAHRQDEYLQAARVAIAPRAVKIELDLTPGIALADAIVADIDRNRDGSFVQDEQVAYGDVVLGALVVEADGTRLHMALERVIFPDGASMRRGEGTIRIQSTAMLPLLAAGSHQLLIRNTHHPDGSVYLANALVPENDRVSVTGQRRDGDQRELVIEYVLREPAAAFTFAWFLTGIVAVAGLSVFLVRRSNRL